MSDESPRILPAANAARDLGMSADVTLRTGCVQFFNGARLCGSKTIESAGMEDGSVIVVLKARVEREEDAAEVEDAPPTREDILQATAEEARKRRETKGSDSTSQGRPQRNVGAYGAEDEVHLQRLVDSALRAGLHEDSSDEQERMFNEEHGDYFADEFYMERLQDMGFPDAMARRALTMHNGDMVDAMEWLLEHRDEPEASAPLTEEELRNISRRQRLSHHAQVFPIAGPPVEADQAILERLVEMGFEEERAAAALRFTRNNEDAACALLLGDLGDIMQVDVTPHIPVPPRQQEQEGDQTAAPRHSSVSLGEESQDFGPSRNERMGEAGAANHARVDFEALSQSMAEAEHGQEEDLSQGTPAPAGSQGSRLHETVLDNNHLVELLQSQRVMEALETIARDPRRTLEYVEDPEIGPVIEHLHTLFQMNREHASHH